jgi:glycosyltransferase involved in cell wall biosynthesis
MMKISFVLPFSGHRPVGGFKVAYEYANGLARRGHEVLVYHSPYRKVGENSPVRLLRQLLVYGAKKLQLFGGYRPDSWFRLDPDVQTKWLPSLHSCWIEPADAVVATSWETAEWVERYPLDRGQKHYLIQHQESTFPDADPQRAMATWKMPFRKIVIAGWLHEIAREMGEQVTYIPNGLDFTRFNLDIPVESRKPQNVIMLFHHLEWKGSRDGLAALYKVKEEVPSLSLTLFGIPERPGDLPDWITYERNPEQKRLRRLYNEAAIFVGPSWAEGWPLPPAEAAQCGAALCLTDIGGHREYGIQGETALLSPPRAPDAMAHNILCLLQDNRLRVQLGKQAHDYVRQFTWDRAVTSFESHLLEKAV